MEHWHNIDLSEVDSPALLVDKESVEYNINLAIEYAGGADRLRPHVKTHKTLEVAKLQIGAGLKKFKCATIAEAEMLGIAGAEDVLIAFQPQGPKINRVLKLINRFPQTKFSVLIDHEQSAIAINEHFEANNGKISVYIDINVGQNRTGTLPTNAFGLMQECYTCPALSIAGLHCYDGHIHMTSYEEREASCQLAFQNIESLRQKFQETLKKPVALIAGGSPSFLIHAKKADVECSPGTFIFWDDGYASKFQEQKFKLAAVILCRVISKIDSKTYCLDLGHKSIASEMPLPRVKFIGRHSLQQIGHSEEHLVVTCQNDHDLQVGECLLAIPKHICPTVALYEFINVVENGKLVSNWKITARNRQITI